MDVIENRVSNNTQIKSLKSGTVFKYRDEWYMRYATLSAIQDPTSNEQTYYYGVLLRSGVPAISKEESNNKPDIIAESITVNY